MGMADVLSKAWNSGRAYASWIGLRVGAGGVTQPHSNGRHKIGRKLWELRHRTCSFLLPSSRRQSEEVCTALRP